MRARTHARTTRMRWRAHIGIRAYPARYLCAFAQMASACHFACIGRARPAPTATPTRTAGMAAAAGIPPTRTVDGHESPKAPPSAPSRRRCGPGPVCTAHCQSWHTRGVRLCHGRRRRPDHLKPASARWLGCAAWFLGWCARFPTSGECCSGCSCVQATRSSMHRRRVLRTAPRERRPMLQGTGTMSSRRVRRAARRATPSATLCRARAGVWVCGSCECAAARACA
jgi:hypothetical protein